MRGNVRRRGITLVELVVIAVITCVLAAVSAPMYRDYAFRTSVSMARSDLKLMYSSVESYFTRNLEVPAQPGDAVPGWAGGYSNGYSYVRRGPHSYEFSTRNRVGAVYLYIDENGTVGERAN